VQYAQEYSYYTAVFKGPVTGLGKGTVTRFNGIDVGRIQDLQFDPNDPQAVIVTLQVQPHLNIREDSMASIDSQGLTGSTYVEISGGTVKSPLLRAKPGQKYPVIRTKQSSLAQLEQSAPEVVAKLNVAASQINDLLNDNNRRAVAETLAHLDQITATLARRSGDLDAILRNTNEATANLNKASADLQPALDRVDLTVTKFGKVADDTDAFIKGDGLAQLSDLISDLRRLTTNLNRFSDQLDRQPTSILFGDRRKGYDPNGK
jgi:phospholipid/cholesterol/gamma-HCH transport system substrate-binding protein